MNAESDYYKHQRIEVARLLPDQYKHVLEIGCGTGQFRSNLKRPCEYVGVEPSEVAANTARSSLDRVLTGTYDSVANELPQAYFDLVVCNDVIEHMADHDAFLENIQRHMKPGAVLVGSVPNVRYCMHLWHLLVGKDWQYQEHGILDRTHLRFFTQKSWRNTLQSHRFVVEDLRGMTEPQWGNRLFRRWTKLALANLIGSDSKFLQIGFRARRGA